MAGSCAAVLQALGFYTANDGAIFDTLRVSGGPAHASRFAGWRFANDVNLRYYAGGVVGVSLDEPSGQRVATLPEISATTARPMSRPWCREAWTSTPLWLSHQHLPDAPGLQQLSRRARDAALHQSRLESRDLSLAHSMIAWLVHDEAQRHHRMIAVTWPGLPGCIPFSRPTSRWAIRNSLPAWEVAGRDHRLCRRLVAAECRLAGRVCRPARHPGYHRAATTTAPSASFLVGTRHQPGQARSWRAWTWSSWPATITAASTWTTFAPGRPAPTAWRRSWSPTRRRIGVPSRPSTTSARIIHARGGQIYMDGANMTHAGRPDQPGAIGADVCHLNPCKTFTIPHGGSGPGMGPICVAAHLAPFLPGSAVVEGVAAESVGSVSAAPWNADILHLLRHIAMMAEQGLTDATKSCHPSTPASIAAARAYYPVLWGETHGH